jgi:hypothetical protein
MDYATDDELFACYTSGNDTDGSAFLAMYARYRPVVRAELERAGLAPREAERRIGLVFVRALDGAAPLAAVSLRDHILTTARDVAHERDFSPDPVDG